VSATEVATRDITETVSATGSVEPRIRVRVSAEGGGRVEAAYFNERDFVSKGQVLVKLDDTELATQLEQAREALTQAEIDSENMKIHLERTRKLFKKGFVSQEEMDNAESRFKVAEKVVNQQRYHFELVDTRKKEALIKAPISGTVIRKNVQAGEVIAGPLSTGSPFAEPKPLAEIADLGSLEVHVEVDEIDVGRLSEGLGAVVTVDALPGERLDGKVVDIASATTGRREMGITYLVKVAIDGHDDRLRLGMTANVDFMIRSKKGVPALPKECFMKRRNETFVFTIQEDRIYLREVETGIEDEDFLEVVAGLNLGETVVVGELTQLTEGQNVKLGKS
jgi:HlyD family secretion protein